MGYPLSEWEVVAPVVRLDVGIPLPDSAAPVVRLEPDTTGTYMIDLDKIVREQMLRRRPKPKQRRPVPAPTSRVDSPLLTLDEAARDVGLTPRSLSKRII